MALNNTVIGALVGINAFILLCVLFGVCRLLRRGDEDMTKQERKKSQRSKGSHDEEGDFGTIVLRETKSSEEGVETSLATSYDVESTMEKPHAEKRQRSDISKRSNDSTVGTFETAVSQNSESVDVHVCNSKTCEICRDRNQQGVTFIEVPALEPKMVDKLRTGPPRWYELGQSFFDLYNEANNPGRSRYDNSDDTSMWGMWSNRKSTQKKKRTLKMISSDGDESLG